MKTETICLPLALRNAYRRKITYNSVCLTITRSCLFILVRELAHHVEMYDTRTLCRSPQNRIHWKMFNAWSWERPVLVLYLCEANEFANLKKEGFHYVQPKWARNRARCLIYIKICSGARVPLYGCVTCTYELIFTYIHICVFNWEFTVSKSSRSYWAEDTNITFWMWGRVQCEQTECFRARSSYGCCSKYDKYPSWGNIAGKSTLPMRSVFEKQYSKVSFIIRYQIISVALKRMFFFSWRWWFFRSKNIGRCCELGTSKVE